MIKNGIGKVIKCVGTTTGIVFAAGLFTGMFFNLDTDIILKSTNNDDRPEQEKSNETTEE